MPFSTCCGCETEYPEIDICPECLEHCDWEDDDELEYDIKAQNELEEQQINKSQNQQNDNN